MAEVASASEASGSEHIDGVAFLLAQLGHHAAGVFADQIATIDLTPPHAGILRAVASEPGRSQQTLSARLGLLPSRVVAYVDELEDRGYVERRRNPSDRRLHALYLTAAGKKLMRRLSELARRHEQRITAALDAGQRDMLRDLLTAVAQDQGLAPHVHPGYHTLGRLPGSPPQAGGTRTSRRARPSSSPAGEQVAKPAE